MAVKGVPAVGSKTTTTNGVSCHADRAAEREAARLWQGAGAWGAYRVTGSAAPYALH
jgi:hypothetical protein